MSGGREAVEFVREYTCICCPLGCSVQVRLAPAKGPGQEGCLEALSATGATCKRGVDYAMAEAVSPVRMVTAAVPVEGRLEPLSVKTSQPVPKYLIRPVLEDIAALRLRPPVIEGAVVLRDVRSTGADVVATKSLV